MTNIEQLKAVADRIRRTAVPDSVTPGYIIERQDMVDLVAAMDAPATPPAPAPQRLGLVDLTPPLVSVKVRGDEALGYEWETHIPQAGWFTGRKKSLVRVVEMPDDFTVKTKEGVQQGKKGDFLACGVENELYVIDAAIFAKSYDPVGACDAPVDNEGKPR